MWYYILIGVIFVVFLLMYYFNSRHTKLTGRATVVTRRMEVSNIPTQWSDNYNRLITFRMSDGNELELYVDKEVYATLQDGETGQLTWQGDLFTCFDTD